MEALEIEPPFDGIPKKQRTKEEELASLSQINEKYELNLQWIDYHPYLDLLEYLFVNIKPKSDPNLHALYHSLNLEDSYSYHIFGIYHDVVLCDQTKAFDYYLEAIKRGNSKSMNNIGYCYYLQNDIENMIKYYLMAIDKEDCLAMINLANYYTIINDQTNAIKYYSMAVERKNPYAIFNLAKFYEDIHDIPNMIKYYEMAIEIGQLPDAMFNLAIYYGEINDQEKKIHYYQMAIKHQVPEAMYNLACHYLLLNDFDQALHYFYMALQVNFDEAKGPIESICATDSIKLYYKLLEMEPKNDAIISFLLEIKESELIQYYLQVKEAHGLLDEECPICFETYGNILIPVCSHHICVNCYFNSHKLCYYRCNISQLTNLPNNRDNNRDNNLDDNEHLENMNQFID